MRKDTLANITALVDEYKETLDNTHKDEWYCTNREHWETEAYNFLKWLKETK
jgi:hypothetical protein